jgi:hypothetical protein
MVTNSRETAASVLTKAQPQFTYLFYRSVVEQLLIRFPKSPPLSATTQSRLAVDKHTRAAANCFATFSFMYFKTRSLPGVWYRHFVGYVQIVRSMTLQFHQVPGSEEGSMNVRMNERIN